MRLARAKRERGIALILMMVVLVMGATFFVLRSINAATVRADRYRVTQEALIQAKEALIARAVSDDDPVDQNTIHPGSLPCPDTNDDGSAELFVGNNCPSYIGRLPWRTLGLPDLRDASGERLWYALSSNFRDDPSARPINSNTVGTLTITGTQAAANVVAIVFAPGSSHRRSNGAAQSRSCVAGACDSNAANYLDIAAGVDNADGDSTFVSAEESDTFNDRLIPILSDDIMPLVERRVGREVAQKLRDHFDNWQNATSITAASRKGFYPWPATVNDPTAISPGVSGTAAGLLPMLSASASALTWSNINPTVGTCTQSTVDGTAQLDCIAALLCIPPILTITCALGITARVDNVGTAFVDPPDSSSVSISGVTLGSPTATWTLDATNQRLNFSFSAGSFIAIGLVTITVRAPVASSWTTSSWLATNKWNEVSYYAVAPGYALTGTNSCVAGTTCLTVSNTAAPNDDKQAVVLTAGRTLPLATPAQTARPVATPAAASQYLESENQTPADRVFEKNLRSSAFNDQPTIVRP